MIRSKDFEDILGSVQEMSVEQLNRLSREIGAAKQFAKPSGSDELLSYICTYCRKHHFDYRAPSDLRASRYYKTFMEKHADTLAFLSKFCKSKIEREAICRLAFDEMRLTRAFPMNCIGLMCTVHLIPGYIDRMFPGYDEMGLLSVIARRLAS